MEDNESNELIELYTTHGSDSLLVLLGEEIESFNITLSGLVGLRFLSHINTDDTYP